MKGQVYQAFVQAGLEKEARKLSINGLPAIGHYIAIVDNYLGGAHGNFDVKSLFYYDIAQKILGWIDSNVPETPDFVDSISRNMPDIRSNMKLELSEILGVQN